jgi:lysozyme
MIEFFTSFLRRFGRPPLAASAGNKPVDISTAGLEMVKHFESLFLNAYVDNDDGNGVWTIGYGHTGLQHEDGTVYRGRKITAAEAERLLTYDMNQFENRVLSLVKVPLKQHEFDALVSFDFNTGGLTLERGRPSTLLRYLNTGNKAAAMEQLMLWDNDNGKEQPGLVRRRHAEREMFLGRDWKKYKR